MVLHLRATVPVPRVPRVPTPRALRPSASCGICCRCSRAHAPMPAGIPCRTRGEGCTVGGNARGCSGDAMEASIRLASPRIWCHGDRSRLTRIPACRSGQRSREGCLGRREEKCIVVYLVWFVYIFLRDLFHTCETRCLSSDTAIASSFALCVPTLSWIGHICERMK